MKQSEIQTKLNINNNHLNKQKDNHPFHRIGQLRRAKMHAACLIESIDSNKALPQSLQQLLEASLVLETTNSKILAVYLKRSPATIRNEFQRIRTILGTYQEFSENLQYRAPVNI
jgi:hypothetical protein